MTLVDTAPIACTLNAADMKTRRGKRAELNRTALASYHRDDLRLDLLYAVDARRQVLEMVRAEQTCCAFLTFEVREEPGALRVIVTAPERARDAADSLFEALWSATPSQDPSQDSSQESATACGCKATRAPTDRVVGASTALASAGALVCGICCVLPFALPAAALAVGGGVVSWFAKATPWAMRIALVAMLAGWTWIIVQSVRTRRRPATTTVLTLGFATVMFIAAAVWWHFEKDIIRLLR
jgi:hypothetical protein